MILDNKVILISGAARGIGYSVADRCLAEGAHVIANYRNEPSGIASLINKYGSDRVSAIKADVTDYIEVRSMIDKTCLNNRSLDGIVCNAGIITRTPNWQDFPVEDWYKDFNTNLIGAWNVIRCGIDRVNKGGSIVNVSSIFGTAPEVSALPYSISKAALNAMTIALAKELAPNIRINAILPGNTLTDMIPDVNEQNKIEGKTLLKRSAQVYEIANTIVFLLSDASSYMTGNLLHVDGGYHVV